jgi:beta-galactosidase
MQWRIAADGTVALHHAVTPLSDALPPLPRIGLTLTLPRHLDQLTWFGRGPHESYPDRLASTPVGRYHSTVAEQHYPFIVPQECGGREEVRWLELVDEHGRGLRVQADRLFHFDAHHHPVADYDRARHDHELTPHDAVFLNLDHRHSGLGGDNGWTPCTIHPEFQVRPTPSARSFILHPLP